MSRKDEIIGGLETVQQNILDGLPEPPPEKLEEKVLS
jgi:hypothetical protein